MTDAAIRPYRLAVEDSAIDDLKSRLARVRWPDEASEAPWSFGTSLGFVREMIDYWSKGFDWRKTEAGPNAWPQYTTR